MSGKTILFTAKEAEDSVPLVEALKRVEIPFCEIDLTKYPHRRCILEVFDPDATLPCLIVGEEIVYGKDKLQALCNSDNFLKVLIHSSPRSPLRVYPPLSLDENALKTYVNEFLKYDEALERLRYEVPRISVGVPASPRCEEKIADGFSPENAIECMERILEMNHDEAKQTFQRMHQLGYFSEVETIDGEVRFVFHLEQNRSLLNFSRPYRGPPVKLTALLQELLRCVQCIVDMLSQNPSTDIFLSDQYRYFLHRELELQQCDLLSLEANEISSAAVNLYNILYFQLFLQLGEPQSATERVKYNSAFGLIVGSKKFALDDLLHGIMRGNVKAPNRVNRQFSQEDNRLVLSNHIVDACIQFALVSNSAGIPFPPLNLEPESLEHTVSKIVSSAIQREASVKAMGMELPSAMGLNPVDFGEDEYCRCRWVQRHCSDSLKEEIEAMLERTKDNPTVSYFQPKDTSMNILLKRKTSWNSSLPLNLNGFSTEVLRQLLSSSNQAIEVLNIGKNDFSTFPEEILRLYNLKRLYLSSNKVRSLPDTISQLSFLDTLDFSFNRFSEIPSSLYQLPQLKHLYFASNLITEVSPEINRLSSIRILVLSENAIASLPESIAQLPNLTRLNVSYNQITSLPESLPKSLIELNLSHNCLTTLPAKVFRKCKKLRILDLSKNKLEELPPSIGSLKKLYCLSLESNQLQYICEAVIPLVENSLQALNLQDNPIKEIPEHLLENSSDPIKYIEQHMRLMNRGSTKRESSKSRRESSKSHRESSKSLTRSPRVYLSTVGKGGSTINDLILAGGTSLNTVPKNPVPSLSILPGHSKLSRSIEPTPRVDGSQLILPTKDYRIEIGGEDLHTIDSVNREYSLVPEAPFYEIHFKDKPQFVFGGYDPDFFGYILVIVDQQAQAVEKARSWEAEYYYNALVRLSKGDRMCKIPSVNNKKDGNTKQILKLCRTYLGLPSLTKMEDKIQADMRDLDSKLFVSNHKIGVLYTKAGQKTEDEFYNNEHGSDDFEEFLTILGRKIELKDWNLYEGGLDTIADRDGKYTYFATEHRATILYHISTYLKFKPNDEQQIERKKHLGNDVAMVVFQDGPNTFNPTCITSQFNSIFIVVTKEVNASHPGFPMYKIAVATRAGMSPVAPFIGTKHTVFDKTSLKNFIIKKVLNSEIEAWKSLPTFANAIGRAREIYLGDIFKKYPVKSKKRKAK